MHIELYIERFCPYSIRARIALEEKRISFKTINVSENTNLNLDFLGENVTFPFLKERDYKLSDKNILIYYINERYPSPNLMPNQPSERAEIRLASLRIENEWFAVFEAYRLETDKDKKEAIKEEIYDALHLVVPLLLEDTLYIKSNEFTLADAGFAAMLICFAQEGFVIDEKFGKLFEYRNRLFERESVQRSIPKNIPKRLKKNK